MRALREFVIKPDGTQRRARQHRSGVGGGKEREKKKEEERKKLYAIVLTKSLI